MSSAKAQLVACNELESFVAVGFFLVFSFMTAAAMVVVHIRLFSLTDVFFFFSLFARSRTDEEGAQGLEFRESQPNSIGIGENHWWRFVLANSSRYQSARIGSKSIKFFFIFSISKLSLLFVSCFIFLCHLDGFLFCILRQRLEWHWTEKTGTPVLCAKEASSVLIHTQRPTY